MQSYKTHLKETAHLAYPVAIGQLGHIMLGVMDSVMVGKVGAAPLAASSLVNGLGFLILVFGLGMSLGITPLIAIARGQNNFERCGLILRNAVVTNTLFGVLLSALVWVLSRLIPFLRQQPEVAELAVPYARIIALSFVPFVVFQTYRQFIEGLGFTRPAMYVTILANFVNVAGNWILIYGHFGFPAMGLAGAGYATLLSRIFMALALGVYVHRSVHFRVFNPGLALRNPDWPVIRRLFAIGLPSGVQNFFEVAAFSFSAVMIGWLGSKPLAAHQIALSMASVTFMIILGISAAATIRVSQALGRGDIPNLRRAGYVGSLLAGGVMALFGIGFILLRRQLPALFINEPEVIAIAASLLIVAAIFQISDGTQAAGLGILRGITDVKLPMVFSFIAYWVIGIPVEYLLGFTFGFGAVGVWTGFIFGLTLASLFFNARFHYKTRQMLREVSAD
jgi:MATE family multidrug resistance protein